ncbi:hypothetical protein DOK67_0000691 [Enterococcus sp. DIV0212c]|uniref:hypothetical protein n=1 Tax=Enterococcus sp. DIV0212c TaxID=2230867 RepID=UPI001A9B2987|nr:hypothetical protein [Enterococcus sp. DIV0212c]MBO1354658.1 hypothetical protein [Enterococcus sp. DIV0212c]
MKKIMNEIAYFVNMNNKMYQFLLFIQPIYYLILIKGLSMINGSLISSDIIINSALTSMVGYTWYSSGSIIFMEKSRGTFELLVLSPKPLWKIIFLRSLSYVLVSSFSFFETLLLAKLFLNINYYVSFSSACISVVILLVSMSIMGCYFAILFGFSRNIFELQDIFLNPIILLVGIFNINNEIIRTINRINPLSISIECLKVSFLKKEPSSILYKLFQWGIASVFSLIIFIILTKIIENKIRRKGGFNEFN